MSDNPITPTQLSVTQADRDLAKRIDRQNLLACYYEDQIDAGHYDHVPLIQQLARHRTAAQSEREAVLEEALLRCASRFTDYADLHAEKLWDGSLSEAQRQTVRDKVDRNLRYAAEARAALTTPVREILRREAHA